MKLLKRHKKPPLREERMPLMLREVSLNHKPQHKRRNIKHRKKHHKNGLRPLRQILMKLPLEPLLMKRPGNFIRLKITQKLKNDLDNYERKFIFFTNKILIIKDIIICIFIIK